MCLSVSEIIYILKDGPEGERGRERDAVFHWAATGGCMKSASSSTQTPFTHAHTHTSTGLTHMSPSEIKNHALETAPSLQPKDWEIWLMMWKLLWQSKVVFVHMLYTIFHQGWSCPRATTQADFLSACCYLNSKDWNAGQLHPPPHLNSHVFLPVNVEWISSIYHEITVHVHFS